ncbi:Argonaute protein [Salix suchowensis]|nr:Argonaute protein [Salix suchowensis]
MARFLPVSRLNPRRALVLTRARSVRPSIGRMLINIDISMAAMYKSGSVLDVALDVLGARDIRALSFDARDPKFRKLERYFKKRMITVHTPQCRSYFRRLNNPVRYPDAFGIIISRPNDDHKQIIPAEFCKVVPGQFYKGKIPEDIQSGAIQKFSTMRPEERLKAIQTGHIGGKDLPGPAQQYPTNDLIHDGGMSIDFEPLKINGRVLDTPDLQYGGGQPFSPQNGAWNVVNKKFYTPERLGVWSVVNFELSIPEQVVENFARNLQTLNQAFGEMRTFMEQHKLNPNHILILAILPQNAAPLELISNIGVMSKLIVFFRDGVSEGEYSQVAEKEIPAIQGMAGASVFGRKVDADMGLSVQQLGLMMHGGPPTSSRRSQSSRLSLLVKGMDAPCTVKEVDSWFPPCRHHVRFFPAFGR